MSRTAATAITAHFRVHDAARSWAVVTIDARFVARLRKVFVQCVDQRLERVELPAHNVTFHKGEAVHADGVTLVVSDQGSFWWTVEPGQHHKAWATEQQSIETFAANLASGTTYFAEDPEALRRLVTERRRPEARR